MRLWGPSVGNDSVGMAALSAAASLVRHGRGTGPFWIVATIGEEGMSNLTGIRHAIATVTNPGGEAINARARDAWFEVDLRADSMRPLQELEDQARQIIREAAPGLSVEVEDLGRRPAGSIAVSSPIVRAAIAALGNSGIAAQISAASTDANAAYEAGIPSVAVGVTGGAGEHTPAEWIETAPVAAGLTVLAETIELIREGQE